MHEPVHKPKDWLKLGIACSGQTSDIISCRIPTWTPLGRCPEADLEAHTGAGHIIQQQRQQGAQQYAPS